MYAIEFLPSAARAFAKLDRRAQVRIARRIDRLAMSPRQDAAKLRGSNNVWRVRVGDCRVLYQISDERLSILVIRIGHRRDVYRRP